MFESPCFSARDITARAYNQEFRKGCLFITAHSRFRIGIGGKQESEEGLVVDNEPKCPVSGKRKYATEGEALATATHQIATTGAPKELRAYLCSWCGSWHLTKNTGRTGKDRRQPPK
jgi:hypothetical protein